MVLGWVGESLSRVGLSLGVGGIHVTRLGALPGVRLGAQPGARLPRCLAGGLLPGGFLPGGLSPLR